MRFGPLLTELGMDTSIDHVTDFTQIAAYGVMTTPPRGGEEKWWRVGGFFKKKRERLSLKGCGQALKWKD